jgi:hypothetical protein
VVSNSLTQSRKARKGFKKEFGFLGFCVSHGVGSAQCDSKVSRQAAKKTIRVCLTRNPKLEISGRHADPGLPSFKFPDLIC